MENTTLRPFLKWAGGKYRLRDTLLAHLPSGKRLLEPFVGAGALFLNANYERYLLADSNRDLIQLYQQLKRGKTAFIDQCQTYFKPKMNDRACYYALREQFNQTSDLELRAMLFLYLNRHGYNGLCRYNRQGEYNVPFGFHHKPYFPRAEMQDFCDKAHRMSFKCASFNTTMRTTRPGDVVYCDPPYLPLSKTSAFTNYDRHGFTDEQQQELADLAQTLQAQGITVVISNHDTAFARELYQHAEIHSFLVPRFISCQGAKRKRVRELLAVFAAATAD